MSSHTGRRHSPQRGHNSAGKIIGNVFTQAQHGVVPGKSADGINVPFPIKPVYHKRSVQPSKQDGFAPYDLEKAATTKQPRDPSPPQEQLTNGKDTNGCRDPINSSDCRQASGELQMDRAIYAGKLMLQDKLWILAEKMRQKKQRDAAAAALDDQKNGEQRRSRGHAEGGQLQTKPRLPEQQRREPVGRRETKVQERGRENFQEHVKIQGQEERAGGPGREMATHQLTVLEQEASGELSKPRWEKVKHEEEKWLSDHDRDTPQTSQQKASREAATGGRKPPGGATLPPVSHPSRLSGPQPGQNQKADSRLQLLPCKICKRKFASQRLQKHVQICEKVKQSPRGVFNSCLQRIKGSENEKFLRTLAAVPVSRTEVYGKGNHSSILTTRVPLECCFQECVLMTVLRSISCFWFYSGF